MSLKIGKSPEKLGIKIPASKMNAKGHFKVKTCPECVDLEKGNPNDSSLSVNLVEERAKCHKCGTKFFWGDRKKRKRSIEEDSYDLPKDNLEPLGREAMEFIKNRGITDEKIIYATVKQSMRYDKSLNKEIPWIAFPYYKIVKGELILINVKYRSIREKAFAQEKNGEPSLWLSHMATGAKNVIITEGEFDDLAIMCSLGVEYMKENSIMVLSMNGGAINAQDKDIDGKLKGFYSSYEETIQKADTVFLATDDDGPGQRLKEELSKRITDKDIKVMSFGTRKDANELLLKEGAEAVKSAYENSVIELPAGISRLDDYSDSMWDQYENGLKMGTTTYFPPIDLVWKWRSGEVTIFTGYANEGKSTVVLHLAMVAAIIDPTRKFLVFSPENIPQEEFFEDLIHSFIGKPSSLHSPDRMSREEYQQGMDFMNQHFFLMYPTKKQETGREEEDFTMLNIEAGITGSVRAEGITDVIIDPYNMVEHDLRISDREDLYISKFMTKLKRSALANDVSVNLVAHQLTPRPDPKTGNYPMPSMYTIKGGGTFADKADNVVSIWRPYRRKQIFEHVLDDHKKFIDDPMSSDKQKEDVLSSIIVFESEKIKKQKLLGSRPGEVIMLFDYRTVRYTAIDGYDDIHGMSPLNDGEVVEERNDYEARVKAIEDDYKSKSVDVETEDVKGDVPF